MTVTEEIRRWMNTEWLGKELIYKESTDSTNTRVKELAAEGALHGTVVAAGAQTDGKGRRGRSWVSPPGVNVYLSVLFRPEFPPARAPMLTMVAAYAMAQAIQEAAELPVQIKWPNDLVIYGKKICGILTEMSVTEGRIQYVVTGIGMNTNMTEFPQEIEDMATSLRLISGREIDRARLMGTMLNYLEKAYDRYEQEQNLEWLQDTYNALLVNYGKEVRVLDPGGEYSGAAEGIDGEGRLLVRKKDGGLIRISSGEVSVRGVYGYAE